MIGHQDIRMDATAELFRGNAQGIEVIEVIGFGEEAGFAVGALPDAMLGRPGNCIRGVPVIVFLDRPADLLSI